MPDLNQDLENFNLVTSHYGFSGTRIEELDASKYTLATLIFDRSGSTINFRNEMKAVADKVVEACKKSPTADNLMLRLCEFSDDLIQRHGFRRLNTIQPNEYDYLLGAEGGFTALYDAVVNGVEATDAYAKTLTDNEFTVNGIVFIISDGKNNKGVATENTVKQVLNNAIRNEQLESLTTVLIGVNLDSDTDFHLQNFYKNAGISQYINIGDATSQKLAKLADFVSKSVSSTSQAIGSGGPSQAITF